MKVFMYPHPNSDAIQNGIGGIHTAVRMYAKFMPKYGIEFVDTEEEADLIAVHAGSYAPVDPIKPVVSLCHGLHWSADYKADPFEFETNAYVIQALRRANKVVVPSEWVATTLRRDMRINPVVIGHAVDDSWQHKLPVGDYVLWNKNRDFDVCKPTAVNELAKRFPHQKFLTTFADPDPTPNIKVTGPMPFSEMKPLVQQAQVYLSSTKETFGIGILEAMMAGVPVLGFAEGGILELITHKVNGYLATPGDYDDLAVGLEYCLDYRKNLSKSAVSEAKHFTWDKVCRRLVDTFEEVLTWVENPTVSVVIPCFNYGHLLERAIASVRKQTFKSYQIVIVDNNSTDNTREIGEALSKKYPYIFYINEPKQGVAHARNAGISHIEAKYVCCLDADDEIAPSFLETCVRALEADPLLGIAYTGLRWEKSDGGSGISEWPGQYNYDLFLDGKNQVPTCCVFRYEMWARLGGYRQRYAPDGAGAEDAEFFLRAGSIGFPGRKVSDAPLFTYHVGEGYVSGNPQYHEENWRAWHPWVEDNIHPFASMAAPDYISHAVHQYDQPDVSVIIPLHASHLQYLVDALDSLEAQTFRNWEAVVVVDAGFSLSGEEESEVSRLRKAYPFVNWLYGQDGGAGHARNLGAKEAKGPFLLFLDADDWLEPDALAWMIRTWNEQRAIVYTDYYGHAVMDRSEAERLDGAGRLIEYRTKTQTAKVRHNAAEYDQALAARQPELDESGNFYLWNLITSLVPAGWHKRIGGFDEEMVSWEDWDYWLRFARASAPFVHLARPLVHYRFTSGNRREIGLKQAPQLIAYLQEKKDMCCSGPQPLPEYTPPPPQSINQGAPANIAANDYQMIELVDGNIGGHPIRGPQTKIDYGYRAHGDQFLMHVKDIELIPHEDGKLGQKIHILTYVGTQEAPQRTVQVEVDRTNVQPDNKLDETEKVTLQKTEVFAEDESELSQLKGLSPTLVTALEKQGVISLNDLLRFGTENLITIKGIGERKAQNLVEQAIELMNVMV